MNTAGRKGEAKVFYGFRFNAALAAMNISPAAFSSDARIAAQGFGKSRGLTPQETALVLVSETYGIDYPTNADVPLAVQVWEKDRKIFPNKPEVEEALINLALF